jgi:type I restriction enzyme R subunit
LELLLADFRRLLADAAAAYLQPLAGGKDKQLEHMLYDVLLDPAARQEFIDRYKQIEALYEILSPSPELREHIDSFRKLADLYLMVRNAYASPTRFYEDVARKTEQMVREQAAVYGPIASNQTVEFDQKTLESLRTDKDDNASVVNLVRAIEGESAQKGEQEPVLIDIAQRARAILDALEQRTVNTATAMEKISALVAERAEADKERKRLGLDPTTFSVYWRLHSEGMGNALLMANEIAAAAARYPNHAENEDELRQLKAEIYRSLMREASGAKMVAIGEALVRLLSTRQS